MHSLFIYLFILVSYISWCMLFLFLFMFLPDTAPSLSMESQYAAWRNRKSKSINCVTPPSHIPSYSSLYCSAHFPSSVCSHLLIYISLPFHHPLGCAAAFCNHSPTYSREWLSRGVATLGPYRERWWWWCYCLASHVYSSRFGQHEVATGTQQWRGRLVTARWSIAHLSTALQLPHVSWHTGRAATATDNRLANHVFSTSSSCFHIEERIFSPDPFLNRPRFRVMNPFS